MNNLLAKVAILIWLCLFVVAANSQDTLFLQIVPLDKADNFLNKEIKYESTFTDTLSLQNELKRVLVKLQTKAYMAASFDEVNYSSNEVKAKLYIGDAYEWASLKNGNIEVTILEAIGWRQKDFDNQKIDYQKIIALQERLLVYAENNGYPFAQVWLDSLQVQGEELSAQLFMRKNKRITIDAINIIGDAKISDRYLLNYLGLEKGMPFDKSKILEIQKGLQELPFVQGSQAPKVTFKGDKATVNLFLKNKNASRFDLIFGVLPNSNPILDRRLLVTGTGLLDLQNAFGQGEHIYAKFQQLRPQTQEAELAFSYPYLFNQPFGTEMRFNLYKRDTSYLDLESDLGLQYFLEGDDYLKVFWNNKSTNLLSINENQVIQSKQLPARLDVQYNLFGVEYMKRNLDYRFNPRRGWTLFLRGGAGQKRIKESNLIVNLEDENDPSFDYRSLYDSLSNEGSQYRLEGRVEVYLPLASRSTFKLATYTGTIISDLPIFQNEAFRIGGNQLLRGFDEESIFSSFYSVFTMEYRWLLTQNSNIFLFTDVGYVENLTKDNRIFQRPMGFGTGISFETSAGVFGISAAVGRDWANVADFFDFRSPKIHFGYISLF